MATWEFTESDRLVIDSAVKKITNSETLTTEEAILYGKFEAYKAVQDAEFKANIEQAEKRNQAEIEESRKTAQQARENLKTLSDMAVERYERTLNNGQ